MNRYKFRGKAVCSEELLKSFPEEFYKDGYVYGYLVAENIIAYGVVETHDSAIVYEYWAKVDPATIGQYTGKQDYDKSDVYEHDIVMDFVDGNYYRVVWDDENTAYYLVPKKGDWMDFETFEAHASAGYRVVGNKVDNPELLEG